MSEDISKAGAKILKGQQPMIKLSGMTWRLLVIALLFIWAVSTPGFLSAPTFAALVTKVSVIGCIAIAMTFITLGGYVMSFALGATAAASSIVFVYMLNAYGMGVALPIAMIFGAFITGIQGVIIGSVRANSIITSIAAGVLIYGSASWLINNETAYMAEGHFDNFLSGRVFGIPTEFFVFLAAVGICQLLLSYTVFGRHLLLIGSGRQAAEVVGLKIGKVTTVAYSMAGALSAVAGILLAVRYRQGHMEMAANYDYDAIAAVLVGGTAILGGAGSMLRTLLGVMIISVIEIVLLLNGFREEWRFTITGILVIVVVILYAKKGAR